MNVFRTPQDLYDYIKTFRYEDRDPVKKGYVIHLYLEAGKNPSAVAKFLENKFQIRQNCGKVAIFNMYNHFFKLKKHYKSPGTCNAILTFLNSRAFNENAKIKPPSNTNLDLESGDAEFNDQAVVRAEVAEPEADAETDEPVAVEVPLTDADDSECPAIKTRRYCDNCSKLSREFGEIKKNYKSEMRIKSQEIRDIRKKYNVKVVNQAIKRKSETIQKLRRKVSKLRKEVISLQGKVDTRSKSLKIIKKEKKVATKELKIASTKLEEKDQSTSGTTCEMISSSSSDEESSPDEMDGEEYRPWNWNKL